MSFPHPELDAVLSSLTARERQIVDYVAAGRANKVIAIDLGISLRTVEAHRARIFAKLGARNAMQLACRLCAHGRSGASPVPGGQAPRPSRAGRGAPARSRRRAVPARRPRCCTNPPAPTANAHQNRCLPDVAAMLAAPPQCCGPMNSGLTNRVFVRPGKGGGVVSGGVQAPLADSLAIRGTWERRRLPARRSGPDRAGGSGCSSSWVFGRQPSARAARCWPRPGIPPGRCPDRPSG